STVAVIERQVRLGIADSITPELIMPLDVAADCLRVRIEDDLVGVEAVAVRRIVRTVNTITVKLPRLRIGQVAMPDLVGLFRQRNALRLLGIFNGAKETQLNLGGMFREQGEVDARPVKGCTERIGATGPDSHLG